MSFPNTRHALYYFDHGAAKRKLRLDQAATNAAVHKALDEEKREEDMVREAYYLDTASFNTRSACMVVDLNFIRKTLKDSEHGKANTQKDA